MKIPISSFYIANSIVIGDETVEKAKSTGHVYLWQNEGKVFKVGATWLHPAARAAHHIANGQKGSFQVHSFKVEKEFDRGRIRDGLAHKLREIGLLANIFEVGQNSEIPAINPPLTEDEDKFVAAACETLFPSWLPPIIETDRLILRGVRESDVKDVFAYASKQNVTRFVFFDQHKSLKDAEFFINEIAGAYYRNKEPEPYAITIKGSDTLIGTCGCFKVSKGVMEMGYVIDDEHWGKGYVPEAGKALVDHVFKNYDVGTIRCRSNNKNEASKRVMEKIGFKFDGVLRSAIQVRGEYWDMHMTSILRSEWETRR